MYLKKMMLLGTVVVFMGAQCWGAGCVVVARVASDVRYTALLRAIERGHTIVALELINSGAPFGGLALDRAVSNGHAAIADALLAKRAFVNASDDLGLTPLHYAAQNGRANAVKVLLARGAFVDAYDGNGVTPLHRAVSSGSIETVKILLAGGAWIDTTDNDGRTVLCKAVSRLSTSICDTRMAELLLDYGAPIDMVDSNGSTALHQAALHGKTAIVKLLLAKNAFINSRDSTGNTAVRLAIDNGRTEALRLLLANGACIDGADIRKIYSSFDQVHYPNSRRKMEKMVGLMINARYDALIKRCPEIKNMENSDVANQVLCALPNEIWAIVAGHLPSRNLAFFRLVSKECRMLAHPILISRAARLKEDMIQFITLLSRCVLDFYASKEVEGKEKKYRAEKKIVMDLLEAQLANATAMATNELLRGAIVSNGNPRCDLAEYTGRYFKEVN